MKKLIFLACFSIVILLFGCTGDMTISSTSITPSVSAEPHEPIAPAPLPTENGTATSVAPSPTNTPVFPPETQLHSQCLEVEATPLNQIMSNGIVILDSRESTVDNRYKPDLFLLDMATSRTTQIAMQDERQTSHIVSPDKKLMAYESVTYNSTNNIMKKDELVIANALGERLITIPWEKGWVGMPTWLDNERLVINASGLNPEENAGDKPATLLILNPFSRKLQILKPDFPKVLDIHATLSAILPFWEGWSGAIYDPTLTRAIYPIYLDDNEDWFTYAIWDPSQRRLIATLEDIYAVASSNTAYPMPKWSPDGSQFVFQGVVPARDPMKYELYAVSRDGETKQLTNLSSVAYVWESTYSWSPDGRYIAMFLSPPIGGVRSDNAHVAVLDTTTLAVTDYCVNITLSGEGYGSGSPLWSPIWSPDGHQFVITDWYEKDHRHVVLVDIEKKIAVKVAEDVEPVGWMISP